MGASYEELLMCQFLERGNVSSLNDFMTVILESTNSSISSKFLLEIFKLDLIQCHWY